MSEPSVRIQREPMRVFVLSASLRAASFNAQLAAQACQILEREGAQIDHARLNEFEAPGFDADDERAGLVPAGPQEFRRRLEAADAFVIASPEYNASYPGNLKNLIDWASRFQPQPFQARHGMLLSASPSMSGGNRGLWALRVPLEHLGARVYPDMFSLALAHQAFAAEGRLADEVLQDRLESVLTAFLDLAEANKHYACAKTRWYEFLAENSGAPETERVQV